MRSLIVSRSNATHRSTQKKKHEKQKRTHVPNRHDPTPVLPTSSDPPHATRVESLTKLDDGDRTRSVRVHAMKPVPQPKLITVSHRFDRSITDDVLRVRIRRRSESKARTTRIARAHGDARISWARDGRGVHGLGWDAVLIVAGRESTHRSATDARRESGWDLRLRRTCLDRGVRVQKRNTSRDNQPPGERHCARKQCTRPEAFA